MPKSGAGWAVLNFFGLCLAPGAVKMMRFASSPYPTNNSNNRGQTTVFSPRRMGETHQLITFIW
jgi:hypothetical protein